MEWSEITVRLAKKPTTKQVADLKEYFETMPVEEILAGLKLKKPMECKGTGMLRPGFKAHCQYVNDTFTVNAHGSPDQNHRETRDFICPRTLAIGSDLASDSLPRSMVSALQDPTCTGTMSIYVD